LPAPLALAAFGQRLGVELSIEGEWTGNVTNVSGANAYATVTIAKGGQIATGPANTAHPFRCVIPLVS
jgi:hypothetical protein